MTVLEWCHSKVWYETHMSGPQSLSWFDSLKFCWQHFSCSKNTFTRSVNDGHADFIHTGFDVPDTQFHFHQTNNITLGSHKYHQLAFSFPVNADRIWSLESPTLCVLLLSTSKIFLISLFAGLEYQFNEVSASRGHLLIFLPPPLPSLLLVPLPFSLFGFSFF